MITDAKCVVCGQPLHKVEVGAYRGLVSCDTKDCAGCLSEVESKEVKRLRTNTKAERVGAWAGTMLLVCLAALAIAGTVRLTLMMFGH